MLATVIATLGVGCVAVGLTRHDRPIAPPLSSASAARVDSATSTSRPQLPASVGLVLPTSQPVSVRIPTIAVTSVIQELGQNPDGTMQVPAHGRHYDEVGWYKYSPTPGALGPAVLVGHLDSANGPSVFWRLGSLHVGSRVYVTRADGVVAEFRVDQVRRFAKAAFPTSLVYGNTNHAALRLITCGGRIDSTTGHYLDDVIVLASLVGAA